MEIFTLLSLIGPVPGTGSDRASVSGKISRVGSGAGYDHKLGPELEPAISDISTFQSIFTILTWYL